MLIKWLKFSKNIKDQNNSQLALESAAEVIAEMTGKPYGQVMSENKSIDGTTLKRARVRLDSVCMLLCRQLWQSLTAVSIFVYLDSSPQKLGYEMFACSIEILDMHGVLPFKRQLLPLIALSRQHLDARGKIFAFLWLVWLCFGPTVESVTRFLGSVVCICSDMGAERKIARSHDVLGEFFSEMLRVQTVQQDVRESLLPLALQAPGWNHGWDIVMKRGLLSLPWFAKFLEGLRAVIHFFRTKLLLEALCSKIKANGFSAIARMLHKIEIPSVADWRWGTLWVACIQLNMILGSLRDHWDASLFTNAKDPKTLRRVGICLNSVNFHWQFSFVLWFTSWLCEIQSWGKGSAERESGQHVDHMDSGRRLAEAEVYVQRALRSGLDYASGFSQTMFDGASREDVDIMQSVARASYTLAEKRHHYLGMIPWLLARLDQPGIAQRCLKQFASHRDHHPMSVKFLHCDSDLYPDVMAIQPEGSGVSARLQSWLNVLKRIPLDDSVAESPHASGNRLGRHGTRSGIAWLSSSMRLEQNLEDVQNFVPALNEDADSLWYRATSVLQPKGLTRPYKCKPNEYRDRLYHLGKFAEARASVGVASTGNDDDNADDNPADSAAEDEEAHAQVLVKKALKGPYKALKGPYKALKGPYKAL